MSLFPMFAKLEGQNALVVGAAGLALPKIEALLAAGAQVEVVAPSGSEQVQAWSGRGEVTWRRRAFRPGDAAGRCVVFGATGKPEVDEQVFAACREQGVPCNVVDDPARCTFYMPAIVRRGDLQIAISTGGQSPALAQQIRKRLEQQFAPDWERRVRELGRARRRIRSTIPAGAARTKLLQEKAREAMAEYGKAVDISRSENADLRAVARRLAESGSARFLSNGPYSGGAWANHEAAREHLWERARRALTRWLNEEDERVALI